MTLEIFLIACFGSVLSELYNVKKYLTLPKYDIPEIKYIIGNVIIDIIIGVVFVYLYCSIDNKHPMPGFVVLHISASSSLLGKLFIPHS